MVKRYSNTKHIPQPKSGAGVVRTGKPGAAAMRVSPKPVAMPMKRAGSGGGPKARGAK